MDVKVFVAPIFITTTLVLPQYAYKDDDRRTAYLDYIWGNWKEKLTQCVDAYKIVFHDITIDWCVLCKCIELWLYTVSRWLISFRENVITMWGDFTS